MQVKLLGHDLVGTGDRRVVVLNDWLCDTSTWDGARAYLDVARFTWAFTDLRGYGRSRGRAGAFTVLESSTDVLALADVLGWTRFSIVGHSMSSYIAMHLAQHAADRVERIVLLTPPPPRGFGMDDASLAASQAVARDDEMRAAMIKERFATRLSPGWAAYKTKRWLETSDAEAAAGYVAVFGRDGLPSPEARISVPVLAIAGEEDAPPMRKDAAEKGLMPLCDSLEVVSLPTGHYPMQEMPPLTVAHVERFLGT
jgi:pimeloyl-ACP methyl ester carboxylesterase